MCAQGLHSFFITDDNFARNKDWEPILDRLIHLREVEKLKIGFIIQVDTLCHQLPNFIEKCARAGVRRVFIGLENINPDNLVGAKKRQNKITEYRKMLLAWKAARRHHLCRLHHRLPERHVEVDPARHRGHQARTAGRPAGILLSHAAAGIGGSSEAACAPGVAMDPDLNKYDLNHVSTDHPRMSRAEWDHAYRAGVAELLHRSSTVETIMRRVASTRRERQQCAVSDHLVQGLHRLRAHPSARKRLPPAEIPAATAGPECRSSRLWRFYPAILVRGAVEARALGFALSAAAAASISASSMTGGPLSYTDLALTPVRDDEDTTLEMFQTDGAKAYVGREHHLRNVREGREAVTPA